MKNFLPLSLILILFLGNQCTIQKRVHRPGWHVDFKGKTASIQAKTQEGNKEIELQTEHEIHIKTIEQHFNSKDTVSMNELTNDDTKLKKIHDQVETNLLHNDFSIIHEEKGSTNEPKHNFFFDIKNYSAFITTTNEIQLLSYKEKKHWSRKDKLVIVLFFIFIVILALLSLRYFILVATSLLFSFFWTLSFYLILILGIILLIVFLAIPSKEKRAKRAKKRELKQLEFEKQKNQESTQHHDSEAAGSENTSVKPAKDQSSTKIKTLIAVAVGTVLVLFYIMLSR
jgi:ABC-type nickel/cobalt efflux system permease component RcnA